MSDKKSDFDREMTRLEAEIKRLEAEYNMFFAGRLPRLPWETRARVEQMVKKYDRMNLSNTAQRFRFGTVQARFMTFVDLWERHLRAKEEGRGPRTRSGGGAPAAPAAQEPAPNPATGLTTVREPGEPASLPTPVAASAPASAPPPAPAPRAPAHAAMDATRIGDLGRDSDRVTALYDELTRERQKAGEAPLPFDRFATVVKAQLAKLGGGSEVAFRVSVNQGRVTLLAKKADE